MEPSPPVLVVIPSLTRSLTSIFPSRLVCREPAIYHTRNTLLPGWLSTSHQVRPVFDSWSCALCGQAFLPEVLTLFLLSRTNPLRASLMLHIVPQTVECFLLSSRRGRDSIIM